MSFNYAASAATALRLIKQFGQVLPITRITNTVDDATGDVVATTTEGTLDAVVLPAKSTALNAVDGRLDDALCEALTKGKLRFILAAASSATFRPSPNDIITFEEGSFNVLGCTPLNPAGTPIVYKIGAQLA